MEYQDICAQDICAPSLDVARFFEKRGWCLWNGGSQPNWHKSWKTFCETAIILLLYLKLSFFFYIWIKLKWMKVQISESKIIFFYWNTILRFILYWHVLMVHLFLSTARFENWLEVYKFASGNFAYSTLKSWYCAEILNSALIPKPTVNAEKFADTALCKEFLFWPNFRCSSYYRSANFTAIIDIQALKYI